MREGVKNQPIHLFYLAVLFTAIYLEIDIVFNLLVRDPQQRILFSDIVAPILDLLVTIGLFFAAKQSAAKSRQLAIAWGLIALSSLVFAIADTTWAILELWLSEPPFPSLADVFYLLYYPLLLAGVLLLPEKPASRAEQIKKALDGGIVMVAAFLAFWNFLMGPLVASNSEYPLLEQAILIAYPAGDLVLIWALLRIIYKRPNQQKENDVPAFLLAASLMVTIVADCIYTYQAFMGTYFSGGILDIAWRAGILLTGLAGIAQVTAIQSFRSAIRFPSNLETLVRNLRGLRPYFPYVFLMAAYLILMRSNTYPMYMDFFSLSLSVGGIIGLVLLRQVVTLTENDKLNVELQGQTSELEKANQELQNEIAEREAVEQQLTYDSLHDAMTGLPNRVLFLDRLGQAVEYCKRRKEYTFAVLFVDIDHFKVINDSLGHLTGDQLLISAGKRMKECLRSSDTVARLGGDEFAILLEITGEKESVLRITEKLQESLKRPFKLDGHELYITASIGIVMDVTAYMHPEEALRDADIAMYQAKASGKARFETFDIKMRSHAFSRLQMEQEMRSALENGDFQLYYQPILSMSSNELVSFEALIRWIHPTRGLLLPGEFLPVAEESGLILPIDRWVLNEACAQLKKWHDHYPSLRKVSVNVNISNRQFSQPNFVDGVLDTLNTHGLNTGSLKLEITENILISNYTAANEVFTKLRDLGVRLEIDDFGSGYSALGYLQHFPISAIKIDKSFVDEIGKSRKGVELVRAIVSMARELGMEAIAEGIETDEQLSELKSLSCNFGQGFLLSRPLDKDSAEKILASYDGRSEN
jgi:diguanylate cyclase (GGDEF)-like protein